ncbi:carbohydrate ABC transporter permease [Paenibacillus sp. IB182496]|uniref:Carbohydrate ABC transporter permease n=1 Tax=Paenibacillus sabuli TaxID=2772509 RepID=A0A927BW21_9BACL|nr:carbohydrate ABC transporter permease [Paenibacillus sabuli]MBD2846519.1 carbohydrate ABC transporter permease [Paenibacillus sabuli]
MRKPFTASRIFDGLNVIILGTIAALMLFPLWIVLVKSVSVAHVVTEGGLMFWPEGFTLSAYETIFQRRNFLNVFANTIVITVLGTAISMILTTCLSYPLSKKRVAGSTVMLFLVFFTMLFNGGLVPNYLVVREVGLLDTLWALMLPQAIQAFNVIIMVSFFRTIPQELEESAKIDGANDLIILFRIVVMTSLPVIATLTLFYAVNQWNTYFQAVLYINSEQNQVLQVLLRQLILQLNNQEVIQDDVANLHQVAVTVKQAMVIVATLPILLIYPFLQKYFAKGVMIGSIKG